MTRKEKRRIVYSKMVRVLERLRKDQALFENNPSDANVRKRISRKLPLFMKMYKKLLKKRHELSFAGAPEQGSPHKKQISNESTRMDSKEFGSELNSVAETSSAVNSLQSLLKSKRSCHAQSEFLGDSFDFQDQAQFDQKLDEIYRIIRRIEKMLKAH